MIIPKITDFSDAGVFAVAISICSILNIIATLSLNQYQISDQYERFSENDYFVCRLFTIIMSFFFSIVVIFALGYSTKYALVIVGYLIYRNLLHFAYLHQASLQIENHLDYAGKCMIIEGFASFLSFTITYYVTNNLVLSTISMALIGGGLFLITMSMGYKNYLGKRYPMHLSDNRNLVPLLLIGIPLMSSIISPIIITALPKIILQIYWEDEIVGVFSTLTAPTIIIPTLVQGAFTPFIIKYSNMSKNRDINSIRKSYLKTVLLIILFGIICLIVSILAADYVFKLLYGDRIVPYTHYFNYLIVGIVIYSIGMCGILVLITKNQGKEAAISTILALIISAIIFMVSIPAYGIDAATFGLIGSYGVFCLFVSICVLFCKINTDSCLPDRETDN